MLFEFDSSLEEIDPTCNIQLRALENLLGAFQNRNHLIFASMKTIRVLMQYVAPQISAPSRAMLTTLLNIAVENKSFVETMEYRVLVFLDKNQQRIRRDGNTWRVSINYLSESGLLQSAIIGENELDAELFLLFGDLYRKKLKIRNFGTRARIMGGGGSGLPAAIESYLDSEYSPCLTVSDSDKFHPEGELSSTAKKCQKLATQRNSIVEFIHIEEREIENLIPIELLSKVVDIEKVTTACEGIFLRSKQLWPYVDLKNGIALKWIRARDQRGKEFWKDLHEKLERKRRLCPFCDENVEIIDEKCSCSYTAGLGAGVLEKCVSYLKDNSAHVTLKILADDPRWEALGKIAFNFAIVPLGERAN